MEIKRYPVLASISGTISILTRRNGQGMEIAIEYVQVGKPDRLESHGTYATNEVASAIARKADRLALANPKMMRV